jgi:hypothetical protein
VDARLHSDRSIVLMPGNCDVNDCSGRRNSPAEYVAASYHRDFLADGWIEE